MTFAGGLAAAEDVRLVRWGDGQLVRWSGRAGSGIAPVAAGPAGRPFPDGIVMHISRCGSTLLARLLDAGPGVLVLHEPPFVNRLLTDRSVGEAERRRLLRALMKTGAAVADPSAAAVVLKCTSWNLHHADRLCAAFPDAPRLLVVRDALEVLVSLVDRPPGWLAGGEGIEERAARAVAGYLDAAAVAADARWALVAYEQLPGAVPTVARHLGVGSPPSAAEAEAVARDDAKRPGRRWRPDSSAKRARASMALRAAHERHTAPAERRLRAVFAARVTGRSPVE
jgi:hypothetical protein